MQCAFISVVRFYIRIVYLLVKLVWRTAWIRNVLEQKTELLRDEVLLESYDCESCCHTIFFQVIIYINPIQTLPAVSHLSLPPVADVVTKVAAVMLSG